MSIAVLPGSFDPITIGHVDLIRRATRIADHVIVGIGINARKTTFLPVGVRLELVRAALADLRGVSVESFEGLLVDFCRRHRADLVIKGIRDGSDVAWEMTQASVNRQIGGVETLLLPTAPELMHVSSSIVRELAGWGMDVSRYVPDGVVDALADNGVMGRVRAAQAEGGRNV